MGWLQVCKKSLLCGKTEVKRTTHPGSCPCARFGRLGPPDPSNLCSRKRNAMYGYLWCGVDSVWHREASSRSGAHARMKGSRPLARATSPTLASPRGIVWPALCAAPSRAVPRVSTGALPHNNKMLRQPKGAGSCQARRSVSAAGRIRPRSRWRISACISLRLSRGPRSTAASARHMPLRVSRCIDRRGVGAWRICADPREIRKQAPWLCPGQA